MVGSDARTRPGVRMQPSDLAFAKAKPHPLEPRLREARAVGEEEAERGQGATAAARREGADEAACQIIDGSDGFGTELSVS